MEGSRSGDELAGSDRLYLEVALARLATNGHIPGRGEREVTIRLDENGRVRWFEGRRLKVPASELEASETPE